MSSLLTNSSAMVALQTLRMINRDLGDVQSQVSTGKKVATASDNAAIWGISAVMQSDVLGFKAISESLGLGTATLTVARDGAETVTGLLQEMKARIVAAQEENVDRVKIQADVAELRNQIAATVAASQFNGLNLLEGKPLDNDVRILGALNRNADQTITTSTIDFSRLTLETGGTVGTAVELAAGANAAAPVIDLGTVGDDARTVYVAGDVVSLKLANGQGQGITLRYEVLASDLDVGDTIGALATAVGAAFNTQLGDANTAGTFASAGIVLAVATSTITLETTAAHLTSLTRQASFGGGLAEVDTIDVSTKGGAAAGLVAIEAMITKSIAAAAAFGSSGKRVELQAEFVSRVSDSLTSGIGALVDADMEAASARLQALQVQQQLGIQALSIANQQPQNILALFRG